MKFGGGRLKSGNSIEAIKKYIYIFTVYELYQK